jgi:hypothetical protein
MKNLLLSFILFLFCSIVFAQAPQKLSYQAMIRNNNNSIIINKKIGMRINIIQGAINGSVVYSERQTPTTNTIGLITIEIGLNPSGSNFNTINWSQGPFFIKTEIDPTGGSNYTINGASELLSVPYALYADKANTITGILPIENGGTGTNNLNDLKNNIELNLKADLNSPSFSGIPVAPTAVLGTNNQQIATTAFVTRSITKSTILPATTTTSGIIKLAGDLGGTADLPIILNDKITTNKIANDNVTNEKISSLDANKITGILSIAKGGTGDTSVSGLKTTLRIDKIDNTADSDKQVSNLTLASLNLKLNKTDTLALSNRINTKLAKTDTIGLRNGINARATISSPTFTGTVSGISKTMVGLANVDNTTDLLKPISTATQTALDLKLNKTDTLALSNRINTKLAKTDTIGLRNGINARATISSPTFTGTVSGINKTMVGLGNVDNTTDLLKPISTATQTAIDLKLNKTDTLALSNRINSKLAKADTVALSNRINTKLAKTDTIGLSNRINLKLAKADTVSLSNRINSKLSIADTAGLKNSINMKLAKADTISFSNRINSKLAKADTLGLSNRINSKLAKADTVGLSNRITARATIASPTFTGTPEAPTAITGTNTTQIATTAFVQDAFTSFSTSSGNSSTLSGAIWTSSTTGTLNGVGFTMTQLRDANPSNWDMSTSDFSAAPLSATQNSGTISHGDDWVVTFASPVSDLKLYCKYWRTASYVFDQPLTLLSSGNGLTSPNSTTVSVGANAWGNGIVQFAGPITTLSVNSSASLINDASGQILTFGVGSGGPTSGTGEIIRSTSPTFTGTVTGITKAMVGLGDVDNTSDLNKPISTATQTALNLKANLASPIFTGTPEAPTALPGTSNTQIATTEFVSLVKGLSVSTASTITVNDPFNFSNTTYTNGPLDVTTAQNLANGPEVFGSNTSGIANVGFGISNLYSNTSGSANTSVGFKGLYSNTTGKNNSSFGSHSLYNNSTGSFNSAFGNVSLISNTIGESNTAFGEWSLLNNTTGSFNTAIGKSADVNSANLTNATAIGYGARVAASNTIQLGNTNVTAINTSGTITAGAITIPNTDGSNGQVLATNGLGALSWTSPVTMADFIALKNKIDSLTNSVVNLNSQIAQLQNSGRWTPIVDSGTISIVNANYFVSNNIVYVSGNFTDANFDTQGYVDINIPVSANFANASDVVGTVLGIMLFGESVSGYVEAIPNTSKVRLTAKGAHWMAFGTKGSFVFSYKLPGATSSSFYTPIVSLGTGVFSSTNYIVKDNIVMVNGNFKNANLDDYGAYIDINLPISTNFVDSSDASGIISGTVYGFESLSGYIYALVGTNTVRLRASGAHGWGSNTNGSFVFSYKINPANNTSSYNPTVLSGIGNFSNANYFTIGNVVYVSGNFTNADFDGMGVYVDISIPGNNFFNNAADVIGSVSGITMGQSVSGYVEAIPNSSTVRLKAAGAHNMAFGTNGSFIFSYINQ